MLNYQFHFYVYMLTELFNLLSISYHDTSDYILYLKCVTLFFIQYLC